MPNKKINALDVKVAVSTDLMLVGDPTTGTAYKSTLATLPLVPYTGATGSVLLGLYGLTAGTLTLQEQPLNGSTYKLTQRMASNDYWSIYGFATVADEGDLFFELQDNAAFANGQRFRFHYGNASSGTPKDILLMDYNGATIDGSVQVNTLAGTGTRMVISDANGALSTQSIPSLSSGGSSVAYYLNGGTAASVGTYYQMSTTAVLGAAADFNLVGNGLISQFLTDVNDPNRLEIPGGNWNFEMYFNISSSGGNTAFYVELLKYDGTTFTSIASNVGTPEEITGGTSIDLYLTSLAIPQTTLLATDRLALRVYIVNNSGGRTVTLHTQDSHLCEIITNFAGGVSALNGLTANTQYFATGTSGTDFAISSVSDTHTFNLPTASGTNRGALSSADWTTFNNKQAALTLTTTGTSGAATLVGATLNIPQYSGGGGGSMAIGGAITSATAGSVLFAGTSGVLQQDNANLFWDDTNNRLGIGTAIPTATLQVNNSVVGNTLLINGASSSALLFNTDSFGRVSINVSSNPSATAQSGAYFTANGHEEAWFNTVARAASTGNKYWRFGNTGGSNTFAIQKLNDSATAVTFTALQISSAGIVQTNDSFNVNKNQNASTNIEINNTTSGTNADCSFKANSNSGSFGQFGKFSTLRTTYKTLTGLDTYVYNNPVGGDISLLNDFGTGKIKFAAGASSTAQATLTAAGRFLLGLTAESTFLLDVNGTARVVGAVTMSQPNGGTFLTLSRTDGAPSNIQIQNASNRCTFAYTGLEMAFSVNGANRIFIDSSIFSVAGNFSTAQYRLAALNTAPATSTSTGTLGEIRIDAGAIYVCTATNTWVRALLTTF